MNFRHIENEYLCFGHMQYATNGAIFFCNEKKSGIVHNIAQPQTVDSRQLFRPRHAKKATAKEEIANLL